MVMWHLRRIESPPAGSIDLTCLAGETPMQVTLEDLDTGNVQVIQMCWKDGAGTVPACQSLTLLTDTYHPNDWDTPCSLELAVEKNAKSKTS